MNENIFFAVSFFPSAAAVLIFSMKYLSAILQARVRRGQDDAYRDIAARVAASQAETASALAAIQSQLAAVMKILKDVE
jgi:hypothetical protein